MQRRRHCAAAAHDLVPYMFVAFVLHALTNRCADQRTGERMSAVNQSAGRGTDERTTGLAVVFAVIRR